MEVTDDLDKSTFTKVMESLFGLNKKESGETKNFSYRIPNTSFAIN